MGIGRIVMLTGDNEKRRSASAIRSASLPFTPTACRKTKQQPLKSCATRSVRWQWSVTALTTHRRWRQHRWARHRGITAQAMESADVVAHARQFATPALCCVTQPCRDAHHQLQCRVQSRHPFIFLLLVLPASAPCGWPSSPTSGRRCW